MRMGRAGVLLVDGTAEEGVLAKRPQLLKGVLQLLMNRHMKMHFAHVHEQDLLLRFVELVTAITSDLPM